MLAGAINSIGDQLFFTGEGKPYSVREGNKFLKESVLEEVEMEFFGEQRKIMIPLVKTKKTYDIITHQFREYIGYMTQSGEMTDVRFREWFTFLDKYDIVDKDKVVGVISKKAQKGKRKYNEIDLLLLKEFLDGKWNIETYQLEGSPKKIPIGQDFKVKIGGKEVELFGMYTSALREAACDPSTWFYKTYSTEDFPAYDQSWQLHLNKCLGQNTLFTCPRGAGKSRTMSRWAVDASASFSPGNKVVNVGYISYSEEALEGCRQHMEEYCGELMAKDNYLFKWRDGRTKLCFYIPYLDKNGKQQYRLKGQVILSTAGGKSYLTGQNLSRVFMDEANRIEEDVYMETMQLVSSRGARFIAGSTIYKQFDKSHWFYKELVKYEIEYSTKEDINIQLEKFVEKYDVVKLIKEKDIAKLMSLRDDLQLEMGNVGIRFKRDDIQLLQDPLKIKLSEQERKTDPLGRFCQNYGCFPETAKILDYSALIKSINENKGPGKKEFMMYEKYFIVRDPAFKFNASAILIAGYKDGQLDIIDERELIGTAEQQILMIMEIEDNLKKDMPLGAEVIKILDGKGVGSLVIEICKKMRYKFDWKVLNTGNSKKITHNKQDHSIVSVNKSQSVQLLQRSLEERIITFDIGLEEVFKQLDQYRRTTTAGGKTKYTGKSGKKNDDFVACLLMLNVIVFEVMGLKREVAEKRLRELRKDNKSNKYMRYWVDRRNEKTQVQKQFDIDMEAYQKYQQADFY